MRANAHRAKWLNCAILAMLVGGLVCFLVLKHSDVIAQEPEDVIKTVVLLGLICISASYFLVNAYWKTPFNFRVGEGESLYTGSSDGDGGCGGD